MTQYYHTEGAVTLDAISRIVGSPVAIKDVIRIDNGYQTAGSITYSSGPYMLTAFLLGADNGAKTSTLRVYVDGGSTAVHEKLCTVGATNTNWLVGMVPGTSFPHAVGSIIGASSLKLEWTASHYYSWQLYQLEVA